MTLPCDEVQRSIPWLLDDELDAEQSLEVEAHLGTCSECRALLEREGRLRVVLRRAAASIAVPASLRHRIHDVMERERSSHSGWSKVWPAVAAAAILLSFIWKGASGGLTSDLDDLALRHSRDLPMDVVAPDIAAVQTYLSGRLPFAVQIPQLAAVEQLKLAGGRIIQLGRHEAAYVRYDAPHGRLSLVVYEAGASDSFSAPSSLSSSSEVSPLYRVGNSSVILRHVRGYTAAQWQASGLIYSVVTDLPDSELSRLLHESLP